MTTEEAVIDRIDLKILNVLQIDGRISNLKLTESAWQRRPGAAVGLIAAGLNANVERYRVNSI